MRERQRERDRERETETERETERAEGMRDASEKMRDKMGHAWNGTILKK